MVRLRSPDSSPASSRKCPAQLEDTMSRTINITVTNRTTMTLYFQAGPSQEGPPCAAQNSQASVGSGGTITVTAKNSSAFNGGNKGTFTLNNAPDMSGDVNFVVLYT